MSPLGTPVNHEENANSQHSVVDSITFEKVLFRKNRKGIYNEEEIQQRSATDDQERP